jgi:glucosamine--fructose-6-phosphate aminotransferase (isomerizing)
MCGIVAYIGKREVWDILISGLRRLEYRGYDSSGISVLSNSEIKTFKKKGKVQDLVNFAQDSDKSGNIGIGHTRWATHGVPNDVNAHPHLSNSGEISLIHNGIIENYAPLKSMLEKAGYQFFSQTDTEVLVNLIEEIQKSENLPIEEAIRVALTKVVGAYAIVVMDKKSPGKIVAARKSSPLVLGVGDGEYFLASDASPIVEWTKDVVYLNDDEIVTIDEKTFTIKNLDNVQQTPFIKKLEMEIESIEKGGWDHYMLKEIHQQVDTINDAIRGRIDLETGKVTLGALNELGDKLKDIKRIMDKISSEKGEIEELVDYDGSFSNSKVPIHDPTLSPTKTMDQTVFAARQATNPLLRGYRVYYGESVVREIDARGAFGFEETELEG